MQPLYTTSNTRAAWQLNWSVSLFGRSALPPPDRWLSELRTATEADGVRILEYREIASDTCQCFVSTRPAVAPAQIVRSLKGRWQHLLRHQQALRFRRNYCIVSVGQANLDALGQYIARQPDRHRMADPGIQERIAALQFYDPAADLRSERVGTYGRFLHSLHVVLESPPGWYEIRINVLQRSQQMIIAGARKHGWLLSRIGLLSNHVHILLGAQVTDAPEAIALSLMNNLAYAHQMQAVLRFSYFVGTCGRYDRNAVRQAITGQ